jgi:serpin B
MAYNGAAGQTAADMATTLGFAGKDRDEVNAFYARLLPALASADPHARFDIANSIWSQAGFAVDTAFLGLNRRTFGAETRSIDFAAAGAAKAINAWVSDKTRGRIPDIVQDPLSADLRLMLINAVYFKGEWSKAFAEKDTRDAVFHKADGSQAACKMMIAKDKAIWYAGDLASVAELPYGDSLFAMDLILPKAGVGLPAVIAAMRDGGAEDWLGHLAGEAEVQVPRVKAEYGASLKPVLARLGMARAFSPEAEFTGINPAGGLAITDVIHKAFLEVDEKGTEAAAATVVEVGLTAILVEPKLVFDRPFLLLIRERTTGAILFLGRILAP